MPNVTFAVPEELHREMRDHPEVKGPEVARTAFKAHLQRLAVYDRLFARSKLTEQDAVRIGRNVRHAASRRRT